MKASKRTGIARLDVHPSIAAQRQSSGRVERTLLNVQSEIVCYAERPLERSPVTPRLDLQIGEVGAIVAYELRLRILRTRQGGIQLHCVGRAPAVDKLGRIVRIRREYRNVAAQVVQQRIIKSSAIKHLKIGKGCRLFRTRARHDGSCHIEWRWEVQFPAIRISIPAGLHVVIGRRIVVWSKTVRPVSGGTKRMPCRPRRSIALQQSHKAGGLIIDILGKTHQRCGSCQHHSDPGQSFHRFRLHVHFPHRCVKNACIICNLHIRRHYTKV